jgi:hypothetical protein
LNLKINFEALEMGFEALEMNFGTFKMGFKAGSWLAGFEMFIAAKPTLCLAG